jgi:hypothetical protein
MQTIKPTFTENLFFSLYNLEPERPMYYLNLYRIAKNIFISCNLEDKLEELNMLIKTEIERPLRTTFQSVNHAYYNPRFLMSKKAYCKIGDAMEYRMVTRYEIMMRLERIKDWIFDQCSLLSQSVRFSAIQQVRM